MRKTITALAAALGLLGSASALEAQAPLTPGAGARYFVEAYGGAYVDNFFADDFDLDRTGPVFGVRLGFRRITWGRLHLVLDAAYATVDEVVAPEGPAAGLVVDRINVVALTGIEYLATRSGRVSLLAELLAGVVATEHAEPERIDSVDTLTTDEFTGNAAIAPGLALLYDMGRFSIHAGLRGIVLFDDVAPSPELYGGLRLAF